MQRDALTDDGTHSVDEGKRRAREARLRCEIDEVEGAHAGDLRGPRRREGAAASRDGYEARVPAARRDASPRF